jgi:thioredoxin 1
MVKEVSDHNFRDVVLGSEVPVLVDFWAPWCGPCHMVSPVVEKLSNKYTSQFGFCKVNVDEAPKTAQSYDIMSIPTLMIFKNGEKVDQVVGAVPESIIRSMMDAYL